MYLLHYQIDLLRAICWPSCYFIAELIFVVSDFIKEVIEYTVPAQYVNQWNYWLWHDISVSY